MDKVKEMFKSRTFWLVFLIIVFVIVFIVFIRRKKLEDEQSAFAKQVREDALRNKLTEKEQELNQYMRKLCGDNAHWMRNYISSYMNRSRDMKEVTARLLKNQEKIGRSFGLWYGKEAGRKIQDMLQKNMIAFGDMIASMVKKNRNGAIDAEKRWNEETDKMATYMTRLNPKWDKEQLAQHLRKFNELCTTQAQAKYRGKHQEEIASFDKTFDFAVNELADGITKGIVNQFPEKFDREPDTQDSVTEAIIVSDDNKIS